MVTDSSGEVAAVTTVRLADDCAYVDQLATRRDQRGRGLAQALRVDAFGAGRAHDATSFELSTDSRTGALGLYQKVGIKTRAACGERGGDRPLNGAPAIRPQARPYSRWMWSCPAW